MTLVDNSRVAVRNNSPVPGFQKELDEYRSVMRSFPRMSLEDVLITISSIHARLTEIRANLVRLEPDTRCTYLRTKELDPLLEATDFQFKCWSRIIHVKSSEFSMAGVS